MAAMTATIRSSNPVDLGSVVQAGGVDKSATSIISSFEIQSSLKSPKGDNYYILCTHPNVQPVSLTQHGMNVHPVDNRKQGEFKEHKAQSRHEKRGDEKKEKTKNVKKKHQQVPRTLMNTTGATIGTVHGGTVYANVTTTRGNSYVQHGDNAQQKYYFSGEKSESESEDDSSATDESSD